METESYAYTERVTYIISIPPAILPEIFIQIGYFFRIYAKTNGAIFQTQCNI